MKPAFRLLLTALPAVLAACLGDDGTSPVGEEDLEMGALVALSGNYSAAGPTNLAALSCALADAAGELAADGFDLQLTLGNTQSRAEGASILLESYLLQGHRVIIGPYTSAEVEAVRESIGASDALLISPSSTALALAQEGDHIFRLAPNDSHLVAEEMEAQFAVEVGYTVPIFRVDPVAELDDAVECIEAEAGVSPGAYPPSPMTPCGWGPGPWPWPEATHPTRNWKMLSWKSWKATKASRERSSWTLPETGTGAYTTSSPWRRAGACIAG